MAAVLLIEDVPVVRMTLLKFLERGGHVVTVCSGGIEAGSRLDKNRFDVVVTDLWMMNGDGLELIQRMRTKGDLTRVIAITGGDPRSSQSTSVDVALRVGANRALSKPVTKAELLETIRECIGLEEKAPERTV
jgi:two-component system chemotaxis response regulator CheY